MKPKYLKKNKLPDSPGVYVFRDYKKRPLYIGRATSLRDRVKSYFATDVIVTRGPRIVDMVTKSVSLSFEKTDSVLEAILLESMLIKKYQPFYNVDERDDKSGQYVVVTDEDWPRVFLARARNFDMDAKNGVLPYRVKKVFGPFPEAGLIRDSLKILRKLFPFRDKKANDMRHERFYNAIGRSPNSSEGSSSITEYNKIIQSLILFFQSKKKALQSGLKKDMLVCAKNRQFEEANRLKKIIFALDHIRDITLLKKEDNQALGNHSDTYRIEAYDVAHLSGTNVVGAMVVSVGGQFVNNEYRKFKISRQINDDIGALVEILGRRLEHSEWNFPNLIMVDGNETHKKAAESVLSARRINIPVIAVTKDDKHKMDRIIGDKNIIKSNRDMIVRLNSEAHRFAIKYHRSLRRI